MLDKQLRQQLFLYNSSSEKATLCVWDIHEFILTILVEGMIYDIFREITISANLQSCGCRLAIFVNEQNNKI